MRQLQHLVALCEELNFARAATKLGITEQALRMSVARLERELGADLVIRNPVTPTQLGRQAVVRARRALSSYERLIGFRGDDALPGDA